MPKTPLQKHAPAAPAKRAARQRPAASSTSRPKSSLEPSAAHARPGPRVIKVKQSFPVVAIGGSAGGLEAFTQLLRQLPDNTGMAFVFIQHLDPRYTSQLPELLARVTSMPVAEAADGRGLEPNRVYVIPSNAQMGVSDGVLHLSPRAPGRSAPVLIDVFFEALARI